MSQYNDVHGTITLELRGRVMFATYSGVLDADSFAAIAPRLQALFDRLNRHYWALVADVSDWRDPQADTLGLNAQLLDSCLQHGMRMLANVVSPVAAPGTNPAAQLRPQHTETLPADFEARDFRYLDEALAWLATMGY